MLLGKLPVRSVVSGLGVSFLSMICLANSGSALAQSPVARLVSSSRSSAVRPRGVVNAAPVGRGPSLSEATEIERRAFALTNAARRQSNLPPLTWDPELCRMARLHSENMVRRGFFSHETPDGQHLGDRAHAIGIEHFHALAENIAYNQGYDDPGEFTVGRWMLSPGHRANILSPEYQQSAIGVYVAPDGTVYVTQEFITR
jgi:uncharacterized protein YkwD